MEVRPYSIISIDLTQRTHSFAGWKIGKQDYNHELPDERVENIVCIKSNIINQIRRYSVFYWHGELRKIP